MTLSVATLNILDDLAFWKERSPLILEGFDVLRPHVIALQEVSLASPSAGLQGARSTAHWLADRLGGYGVAFCPRTAHPASDSLALLTSLPVESHHILALEGEGRQAQRIEVRQGDETWTVVNTHLYWNPLHEAVRVAQVRQLLSWLDGATPAVVCGDFNALPASDTLKRFDERLTSAHLARHGRDPLLTYPTMLRRGPSPRHWGRHAVLRANGLLRLRRNMRFVGAVDYIMIDRDVRVHSCDVLFKRPSRLDPRIYASDHFGLFAVLEHPDTVPPIWDSTSLLEDRGD
jgi:endonuclease/exonuclease/phosphatase family metal-dependent hydrolase